MGMQPSFGSSSLYPAGMTGYVQPNQMPAPPSPAYPSLDSASVTESPFAMSMYSMGYLVNQRNNQNAAFMDENIDLALFPAIPLQETIQQPIQREDLQRMLPPQPQEVEALLESVESLVSSKEKEGKPKGSVLVVD